jgi:hypothetical protein
MHGDERTARTWMHGDELVGAAGAPRLELKLPLANRTPAAVWASIRRHPAGFERLHPPRRIGNVYFDTPSFACLRTSIEGISRRLKLRLRWYGDGDVQGRGQLEWKWRAGRAGWKWTLPVAWEGPLAKQRWSELRERLREELDGRRRASFDALSRPTLVNRYRRSYFVSRDGLCRLTLDEDLAFLPQPGGLYPQLLGAITCPRVHILELKLPLDRPDAARAALQAFPYRPARFSKYTFPLERGRS